MLNCLAPLLLLLRCSIVHGIPVSHQQHQLHTNRYLSTHQGTADTSNGAVHSAAQSHSHPASPSDSYDGHADVHKWVDSLFTDGTAESDHHQQHPQVSPAHSRHVSPNREPAKEAGNYHYQHLLENDTDFLNWMNTVFTSGPEHHLAHTSSPLRDPSPHLGSPPPTLTHPSNLVSPSPSSGISSAGPSSHVSTSYQTSSSNAGQIRSSKSRKPYRARNTPWTQQYDYFGQERIRQAANLIVMEKFGSVTPKRRADAIRKLNKKQKDHLIKGGSIDTIPSSTSVFQKAKDPWSSGFSDVDQSTLHEFADRVMKFRKGSSKSARNAMMSKLSHQELIDITKRKEIETQAIFDRLTQRRPGAIWSKRGAE